MKIILYPACLALLLCISGCQSEEATAPTTQVSQEPVLVQHGEGWQEYKNALDELNSKRQTVQQKYEELERLREPVPGEPVLSDQKSLKETEITSICDEIEAGAQKLLDQTYLRAHQGESTDAQGLVDFAREYRQKIQAGG